MNLEKVVAKDLGEVLKLIKEEFSNIAMEKADLQEKIGSESFMLFKVQEKEKIVGFIEVELLSDEIARINALIVEKKHREKGLGKELMEKTIEKLKEHKVRMISILVRDDNLKAKQLYDELGFEFVSSEEDFQNNAVIEQMQLELDGDRPSYVS